jgi:hypothetical protein
MDGKIMKGRFIMKMSSATSYNFTYEMWSDGTKWTMAGPRRENRLWTKPVEPLCRGQSDVP